MANDQWQQNGERWNSKERQRVARLFRQHVRNPSTPKGRIHREDCFFCGPGYIAEAHHLDYSQPFRIVWLCQNCHRRVDHGSLKVPARAIHDYSSLVIRRTSRKKAKSEILADVPF